MNPLDDDNNPAEYEERLIARAHVTLMWTPEKHHGPLRSEIAMLAERAAAKLARPGDLADPLEALFGMPAFAE